MQWHSQKPEANQGAAGFAVLLPRFTWKPHLLSLGDPHGSADYWSKMSQWNHSSNGVDKACNAR